jgi:large repetitive protein
MSTSQLAFGSHSITVRYWGDAAYQGSTSPVLMQMITAQPPLIISISPDTGYQGTTVLATVSGSNLAGASSVTFSGTGVTATIGAGGTTTILPITITIAANASASTRDLMVTTPGGSLTFIGAFSVLQANPPIIQNINPATGTTGTTVSVTVTGLYLLGASAVRFSGTGVTAVVSNSSATSVSLNVTIAPGAPLGTQDITITNIYGTSQPYAGFTVVGIKKRAGQITSQ